MAVDDLYKLVFQGAMGCEHAVGDPDQAIQWLRTESETMLKLPGDIPIMDPLSPDHRLVRVHIAPFLDSGGDLEDLARAFIQTSQTFKSSVSDLTKYWGWTEAMAARGAVPFPEEEVVRFGKAQRRKDYPPVHHSETYRRLYHPAYRVVLKELLERPGHRHEIKKY